MPKVKSEKRHSGETNGEVKKSGNGWNNGQLFGTETVETTFQGAGFKDKAKALETIKLLEGKDITYQYNIINSMYNRAKVILKRTSDKGKINNLTEAIEVFSEWIDDYKSHNRAKENFNYLPLETVQQYERLAQHYKIKPNGFLKAYESVDGDLKKLRVAKVEGMDITWDVHRNNNLKALSKEIKSEDTPLFEVKEPLKGLPTKLHTQLIMWGFSEDGPKVKKAVSLLENV